MKLVRMALAAAALGVVATASADGFALIKMIGSETYTALSISGATVTPVRVGNVSSSATSTVIGHLVSTGANFDIAQTEVIHDFDGDRTDITIRKYDGVTGQVLRTNVRTMGGDLRAFGFSDLNGDGNREILLQNANTGQVMAIEFSGLLHYNGSYLFFKTPGDAFPLDARFIGVGLVDGDANEDLVFEDPTTGIVSVAITNGFKVKKILARKFDPASLQTNGYNGRFVGVADFNNDGSWDLFSESKLAVPAKKIWFMNPVDGTYTRIGQPTTISSTSGNAYSTGWTTIAVGS